MHAVCSGVPWACELSEIVGGWLSKEEVTWRSAPEGQIEGGDRGGGPLGEGARLISPQISFLLLDLGISMKLILGPPHFCTSFPAPPPQTTLGPGTVPNLIPCLVFLTQSSNHRKCLSTLDPHQTILDCYTFSLIDFIVWNFFIPWYSQS